MRPARSVCIRLSLIPYQITMLSGINLEICQTSHITFLKPAQYVGRSGVMQICCPRGFLHNILERHESFCPNSVMATSSEPAKAAKPKKKRSELPLLPPCEVCGGKATGFHYGANTCEACKVSAVSYQPRFVPCRFACTGRALQAVVQNFARRGMIVSEQRDEPPSFRFRPRVFFFEQSRRKNLPSSVVREEEKGRTIPATICSSPEFKANLYRQTLHCGRLVRPYHWHVLITCETRSEKSQSCPHCPNWEHLVSGWLPMMRPTRFFRNCQHLPFLTMRDT